MGMTIEQILERKLQLERDLLETVSAFEEETGVTVTDIRQLKMDVTSFEDISPRCRTERVMVRCELR